MIIIIIINICTLYIHYYVHYIFIICTLLCTLYIHYYVHWFNKHNKRETKKKNFILLYIFY